MVNYEVNSIDVFVVGYGKHCVLLVSGVQQYEDRLM